MLSRYLSAHRVVSDVPTTFLHRLRVFGINALVVYQKVCWLKFEQFLKPLKPYRIRELSIDFLLTFIASILFDTPPDKDNNIIAKTDETWKAQTFYTAPIRDLSCVSESGSERLSSNCVTTANVQDGSADYGLHWELPANWQQADFDDSNWPNATTRAVPVSTEVLPKK